MVWQNYVKYAFKKGERNIVKERPRKNSQRLRKKNKTVHLSLLLFNGELKIKRILSIDKGH